MRSASPRCAIEMTDDARLALRREQQALRVQRLASHPGGEAGRGEQVVDRHRQRQALLGRKESLEVERAEFVERRLLHGVDQRRHVEAACPRARPYRGCSRAGCARGSAADRRRDRAAPASRDHGADALAQRVASASCSGGGAAKERSTDSGRPLFGARRVDRDVGRVAELRDALGRLVPFGKARPASVCRLARRTPRR